MNVQLIVDQVAGFWRGHGYQVVLVALAAVAVLLAVALVVAWRRRRVDRWVASVAGFAVLALSAEGMWVVAREKLHLPVILAGAVFFVAEAAMVSSAMQANRHYAEHKRPGKHGRAVWVIATVAGVIVAFNSKSLVEAPLRLALPLAAAYLWWNALTADGIEQGEASSWRWTPRRFLLWVGALEAGERDAVEINRDRRIAAMTVVARRVHRGGRLTNWHEARLARLALAADDAMVAEVRARVDRACRIRELTAPSRSAIGDELVPIPEVKINSVDHASGPDPWTYATPVGGEMSDSEPTPEPSAPATPRRPARRQGKRQTAFDRVVKAAARTPSATPAELAARLKISERTVQRHLRGRADDTVTTPQQPSEQVNGATVADLITTD